MGDLNANDYAVEAHQEVLHHTGLFAKFATITNEGLFAISPLVRGLVVDDHFAISVGPPRHPRHAIAAAAFDDAIPFYNKVALTTSASKSRSNLDVGTVIGCHIGGDKGQISADLGKLHYLCKLTWHVLQDPRVTGRTFRQLFAHWNFCLLFRRPILAILQYAYKDLPDALEDDKVFELSLHTRQELGMLCVLTPFMCSNLRAGFSERMECTDGRVGRPATAGTTPKDLRRGRGKDPDTVCVDSHKKPPTLSYA